MAIGLILGPYMTLEISVETARYHLTVFTLHFSTQSFLSSNCAEILTGSPSSGTPNGNGVQSPFQPKTDI